MAGRTRNRHELRRQAEAAEQRARELGAGEPADARASRGRTRAGRATTKVCARWGVYDASMKLVQAFDFKDKPKAEARVAELNAQRRGSYVLQMFKEEVTVQGEGLD